MTSKQMKAAILQCDEVPEKYLPTFGSYSDMIRDMFAAIDVPVEFEQFDCRQSVFPQKIKRYDFFITTGSKFSAYENEPWIQQTIDFIRLLNRENKKLVGICFGHQLIAKAFNIDVEKSPKGWGLGVSTNRVVRKPAWMHESKSDLNIIANHQDQVTTLPQQATVIAESDFCPYFLVQWNANFLSIQGHPEWERDYSRARINDQRGKLSPEQIEKAITSLETPPDNALCAKWIIDFVKDNDGDE